MTQKEMYKKVQLLKAGQIVEIEGDNFQAARLEDDMPEGICSVCDLDSICRGDIFDICCEMETKVSHRWYLKLAHP